MIALLLRICSVVLITMNIASALQDSHSPAVCGSKDIRNSVKNLNKLKGCRVIEGHLMILLIEKFNETDYNDMVFPELTEVTDYVLFFRVNGLKSLGKLFPNLRIIRGNNLLHDSSFIVYEMPHLEEVGLKSLLKIDRGSVWIGKNPALCFVETIDWSIITSGNKDNFLSKNKAAHECPICPNEMSNENSTISCAQIICPEVAEKKRFCWNRSECQQICPPKCGNLTCNANGDCCDESCIGCADNDTSQCLSCRYLTIGNGNARQCVKKCPANTYAFKNSRCVTADECRLQKRPNFLRHESPWAKIPHFAPEDGECTLEWPSNYYPDGPSGNRRCQKCGEIDCKREILCPSMDIDSLSTAQYVCGCLIITGPLWISIRSQNEQNLARELETSLGDIEEIHGELIISSTSLVSLGFFKNLRFVYGLQNKRFGIRVYQNPNLQALFSHNITIEHGRMLFHSNPKLPMKTIEEFKENVIDLRGVDKLPADEVSPDLIRDENPCLYRSVKPLIASVTNVSYNEAILELKPLAYEDERQLLGYILYYRPAPVKNVSMFNNRGECGDDAWSVDDIEDNYPNTTTITQVLTRLKSDTQYAYFIRTYTVYLEQLGGLSPIQYFKTLPESTQQQNADASGDTLEGEILSPIPNSETNSTKEKDEELENLKCYCVYADEKRSKFSKSKAEAEQIIMLEDALHNNIYEKTDEAVSYEGEEDDGDR